MIEPTRPVAEPQVSCEVCLKEVPASEAKVREAEDYVLYFCGLDCFDAWLQRQPTPPADDTGR